MTIETAFEPTHTPQGDVKFSQNNSKCRSELEPTHTPQGDKQTEGTFLIFCTVFQPGTAAEPFSECKKETPETKGQSL